MYDTDLFGTTPAPYGQDDRAPEIASADISDDGLYRYRLTRRWASAGPLALFIMCNPSIADAHIDDATIRRCRGFAKREHCAGFKVVNLYAYRSTDVKGVWSAAADGVDVIGPKNGEAVGDALTIATRTGDPIIAAWGAHPKPDRVTEFMRVFDPVDDVLGQVERERITPLCLGVTKNGMPCHPLMLRGDTPLIPYAWTRS